MIKQNAFWAFSNKICSITNLGSKLFFEVFIYLNWMNVATKLLQIFLQFASQEHKFLFLYLPISVYAIASNVPTYYVVTDM